MTSLRARLALLHSGLFFAGFAGLLALLALPFWSGGDTVPRDRPGTPGTTVDVVGALLWTVGAAVVLTPVALVLGRLTATRALRPLFAVTAAARAMSADTLDADLRVPAVYRELADLADTFDGLRRRLHESFTAQRQFVANASHELRTPLTVQRTLLQLALSDDDPDALRAACHEVLAVNRQQEDLIEALLTLAGSHEGADRWETLNLAEVAGAAAHERPTTLDLRVSLADAAVTGDPRLVASLVANLVDNALRHNKPGGTVEMSTSPPGRLVVSNTGAHIPPDEVARLFRPFQRLDGGRAADTTGGHGLGLAIVAAIAHAHRARLTATPNPDGGLHVTVDFP